jgi:hypothetical protein
MEQIDISNPDHVTICKARKTASLFDAVVVSIKKDGVTVTYSIPVLPSSTVIID